MELLLDVRVSSTTCYKISGRTNVESWRILVNERLDKGRRPFQRKGTWFYEEETRNGRAHYAFVITRTRRYRSTWLGIVTYDLELPPRMIHSLVHSSSSFVHAARARGCAYAEKYSANWNYSLKSCEFILYTQIRGRRMLWRIPNCISQFTLRFFKTVFSSIRDFMLEIYTAISNISIRPPLFNESVLFS